MGVKSLSRLLRFLFFGQEDQEVAIYNSQDLDIQPENCIKFERRNENTVHAALIIDGCSLMCEHIEETPFLGDYASYALAVRHHLEWLHRMGFDIKVVYDGSNVSLMKKESIHDGDDREDKWARFFFTCQGENISEDTEYPQQDLLKYQFKSVLDDLQREWRDANHENDLQWIYSDGEADVAVQTYVRSRIEEKLVMM